MRRPSRTLGVGGVAVAIAAGAAVARAGWSSAQTAGPMTVTAARLAPASGLSATVSSCVKKVSYTLAFTWTASSPTSYVDGYRVLSSATSGGPYTATEASVSGATTTSTSVTYTTGWATTFYVVVEATGKAWTSAPTAELAVTPPHSNTCR